MKLSDFDKVYDQYYLLVMKVAYNVLKDYYYAQDVCQEVFVGLFKKMEEIDETLVKSWLLVTTKRKAIDLQRKKYYGREICKDSPELLAHEDSGPEEKVLKKEFGNRLLNELKQRDEEWFKIIRRVSIEKENPEQVARDLGISLPYLRTKLHRARAWIRKNFEEDYSTLM